MDYSSLMRLETRWENLRDRYRRPNSDMRTLVMAARAFDRRRAKRHYGRAEDAAHRTVECGSWESARALANSLDQFGHALADFWEQVNYINNRAEERAKFLRAQACALEAARAHAGAGEYLRAVTALRQASV